MKKIILMKIILVIVLIVFVVSCSGYYRTQKPQALMGSWQRTIKDGKAEFSAILTFNNDLTFSYKVEDPIVGHVNTSGDVSIMSKKVAFLSDIQCKNAGIYTFSIETNKTLHFTPVNDKCSIRRNVIEGYWTRIK